MPFTILPLQEILAVPMQLHTKVGKAVTVLN
jgi:hypothetical protein